MCPGKSRAGQSEAKISRNTNTESVNVWWTAAVKHPCSRQLLDAFCIKPLRKEPKFELFETMLIKEGQETSVKWYLIF